MDRPNRKSTRQENLLRTFWVLLTFASLAIAVALFDAREDSRALALKRRMQQLHEETVKDYPDAKDALDAMMTCIGKGQLKIDRGFNEEDLNRPRQQCPKYNAAVEALHPSPMGMHSLSLAYAKLVEGLKANL